MIKISNVSKKFKDQLILDRINLSLKEGEKVLFVGQNGAGKSSLMRVILGEYVPNSGEVKIEGFDPFRQRCEALKNVSFVPQTPPPLKLNLSELIYFAKKSANASEQRISELCERLELDLGANLSKSFFKLSGGMKQKFLIALAFGRESKIMIFDEPTANLDPKARDKFREILQEFAAQKTLIFISHRIDEVAGVVRREISMDLGRIVDDKAV